DRVERAPHAEFPVEWKITNFVGLGHKRTRDGLSGVGRGRDNQTILRKSLSQRGDERLRGQRLSDRNRMNPDRRAQARCPLLVQGLWRHVRQETKALAETARIFAIEQGLVDEKGKHRDNRDHEQKAVYETHLSVSRFP